MPSLANEAALRTCPTVNGQGREKKPPTSNRDCDGTVAHTKPFTGADFTVSTQERLMQQQENSVYE